MTPRHFLIDDDLSSAELAGILDDADRMKQDRFAARPLAGPRSVAVIFEKQSTRTRVSFEAGIAELGGHAVVIDGRSSQLGRGETIEDTARVLSRFVAAIVIRTFGHDRIEALAAHASVPVVNALTDLAHPCQILADLLTILETGTSLPGLKVAWLGDGNNVLASIVEAAGLLHFDVVAACPQGFQPEEADIARGNGRARVVGDPREAVEGADVVVTDTWISMGQAHADTKLAAMMPFQVTRELMAAAKPGAKFLHCLPAHRGEEVSAEVIDGPQSLIWPEAENRLHAQKSILRWCFGQLG